MTTIHCDSALVPEDNPACWSCTNTQIFNWQKHVQLVAWCQSLAVLLDGPHARG